MYIPGYPFLLRLKFQSTIVASTRYYTSLNCWEVGRRIHQIAPACYETLPKRANEETAHRALEKEYTSSEATAQEHLPML